MKKIISVILAIVLLTVPVLSVTGSAVETINCPYIFVHGLMATSIHTDKNDPYSDTLFEWSTDEILELVKKALPPLGKFMLNWNYDKLADELLPLVSDFFGSAIIDGDGDVHDGSGPYFVYPPEASITASSELTFRYDWRADPMLAADELNAFIDYVLNASGCSKVVLHCHSLGGVITMAYLAKYGDSKIKSLCFDTTAVYGETYTGELLSGQIKLDGNAVLQFLKYVFDENEYEFLLNSIMKMLKDAGLFDFICRFGNRLIGGLSPKLLPTVVVPLFAGWLSIWDMVPDEYLEASKDYVFNEVYKNSDIDRSGIIEKIDAYTNAVRKNRSAILHSLNDNANLYIISRYGYSSLPITPSYLNLGDGNIDTKYSSFGAVTAQYGSALNDEQINGADTKYISPEQNVNAASCMFPEQTWFINSFKHSDGSNSFDDFLYTLLYSDTQLTVDSLVEYPRYMKYQSGDGSLIPHTQAEKEPTFFEKIKLFFASLKLLLTNLFKNMFKK